MILNIVLGVICIALLSVGVALAVALASTLA